MKINIVIFLICIIFSVIISIILGFDGNWDLLNYHYYNGYAALNNRLNIDIMPSGIQSYFNPVLDIINYLILKNFKSFPFLMHFFSSLPYAGLIFILYLINKQLFSNISNNSLKNNLLISLSVIFGATECIILSEVGTCFYDINIAFLILISFYLLIKTINNENKKQILKYICIAGFICGITCGLKYTGFIYSISLIIAFSLINCKLNIKTLLKYQLLYILFLIIGFLIINGYWLMLIYQKFGNPVFPMLNEVFKSDLYSIRNFSDPRFINKSFITKLFLPFFWNKNDGFLYYGLVCEFYFFDLKHSLSYLSIIILSIITVFKVQKKQYINKNQIFLILFVILSYCLWVESTCILRYFTPILALNGSIIFLTLSLIFKNKKNLIFYIVCILTLIISYLFYYHPNWERTNNINKIYFPKINIPDNSIVLLYGKPLSFIAVEQNPSIKFIYMPFPVSFEYTEDTSDEFHPSEKYFENVDYFLNNSENVYVIKKIDNKISNNKIVDYIDNKYFSNLKNCKMFIPHDDVLLTRYVDIEICKVK